MLTGHATVLLVSDVRRATDYYRDRLGFDVELYVHIPDHYGYAEVSERGAEIVHGAINQGYGQREIRVRDPDGHILAFGQPL